MKSIVREIRESGVIQSFSEIRFGFYSGAVFGTVFSYFLFGASVLSSFSDFQLIDSGIESFLIDSVIESFTSCLGWAVVFFMFVSVLSHLIRKHYGWSRGCSCYGDSE